VAQTINEAELSSTWGEDGWEKPEVPDGRSAGFSAVVFDNVHEPARQLAREFLLFSVSDTLRSRYA